MPPAVFSTAETAGSCLPNELIHQIASLIFDRHKASMRQANERNLDDAAQHQRVLHTLSQLSRGFYLVVRPLLYHTISLHRSGQHRRLFRTLSQNPTYGDYVYSILVVEPHFYKIPDGVYNPTWSERKAERSRQCISKRGTPWITMLTKDPAHATRYTPYTKALLEASCDLLRVLMLTRNLKILRYVGHYHRDRSAFPNGLLLGLERISSRIGILGKVEEIYLSGRECQHWAAPI
ncbi:hypothetical protein BJX70DRAFT_402729 [Aspergillus crustosus]